MSAALASRRIPVLVLLQRAVDRSRVEVIHVAAIRAAGETLGQLALDQPVEEVSNILAVPNAGERGVLPAEAIAAVQRHGHQEPGLARRETQRLERFDAILERHRSHSRWCGSTGVPPVRPDCPPTRPAPAARYSAKPALALTAS
jgi:hypothetical protein